MSSNIEWQKGFPTESGAYLVDLGNSELVVTFWNDGTGKNRDSWGDERATGWSCLTHSRAHVKRWVKTSELLKETDPTDINHQSEG